MPVDDWLQVLGRFAAGLQAQDYAALAALNPPLDRLASYYEYLYQMAKGYVKDPAQRDEQLQIVKSWQTEVENLRLQLSPIFAGDEGKAQLAGMPRQA